MLHWVKLHLDQRDTSQFSPPLIPSHLAQVTVAVAAPDKLFRLTLLLYLLIMRWILVPHPIKTLQVLFQVPRRTSRSIAISSRLLLPLVQLHPTGFSVELFHVPAYNPVNEARASQAVLRYSLRWLSCYCWALASIWQQKLGSFAFLSSIVRLLIRQLVLFLI